MSIQPKEILDVANVLILSNSEAQHRSAISRAYYAAFHSVIDTIPKKYAPNVSSGSSHEAVIDSVKSFVRENLPGRTEAAQIADALPRLKKRRKNADYNLGMDISNSDAKYSVVLAEKIIAHCKTLSSKSNTCHSETAEA